MIDLYYCATPNGLKMAMFFSETGLPHRVIPVDISRGEQFKPEFLAISPNNKIPALVDHDPAEGTEPVVLFESGAMLLYLAEATSMCMRPSACPMPSSAIRRRPTASTAC
jgi:GST-like protein